MAKVTIVFGVVLILLGGISFVLTGDKYPTSLIPAAFGILLIIFGALAGSPDQKRRKLMMHIAVALGLIGFLATATSLVSAVQLMQGKSFPYPAAVEEKAAMALLMLIFVILCVRSFVAARRARA
jgi:peptidoglycan/LPS O-acetylase OafA/YrhL